MVVHNSPFNRRPEFEYDDSPVGSSGSVLEELEKARRRINANPSPSIDFVPSASPSDQADTTSMGDVLSELDRIRGRIATDPNVSQADYLTADAALRGAAEGGDRSSNWLERALNFQYGPIKMALSGAELVLEKPIKALQAGLGSALAGAETAIRQRGDIFDSFTESGVRVSPSAGAQSNLSVSEAVIKKSPDSGYGFLDLFKDEEFQLTVPNVRDQFQINTGFVPLDWVGNNIGLRGIDFVAEGGLMVATDPWTYVTFGTTAWMGASGRAALASRLLEPDARKILASVPDSKVLDNIDDVLNRGEFALSIPERRALAQAGIMGHGGAQILGKKPIPFTEPLTDLIGKGVSGARVAGARALGSRAEGLAKIYTPESRYDLIAVTRGTVPKEEAVRRIKIWSASQASRGEFGRLSGIWASRYKPLIERLTQSQARFDLGEILEQGANFLPNLAALAPEDAALARDLATAFADIKDEYNGFVVEYARRFDLEPEYVRQIAQLQDVNDYFFHTLTRDALRYVIKGKAEDAQRAAVAQTLSTAVEDMRGGAGPILGRKLRAGEEWFGETLQTGSLKEINEISMAKVGFEWFDTDAAGVLASYIQSVSRQAKRMAFVGRLFDYGADTVQPILKESIPDPELLKEATGALRQIDREINRLTRMLVGKQKGPTTEARTVLRQVRALAGRISSDGVRALDKQEDKMLNALTRLRQVEADVDKMRLAAEGAEDNIRLGYETVLDGLRLRIKTINEAIENGKGARAVARQVLEAEHARVFPSRKNRPASIQALADQISGANKKRFDRQIRALETQQRRATGRADRAARQAQVEQGSEMLLEIDAEDVSDRLAALRAMDEIDYDEEIFPDGLMYTSKDSIESVSDFEHVDLYPTTEDFNSPFVAIPAPARQATYDLTRDVDAVRDVLADMGEMVGRWMAGPEFGDPELAEIFADEYDRLVRAGRGTEPDPSVPDEIAGLLRVLTGWGWQDEASIDIANTYMGWISDELTALLSVRGMTNADPMHLTDSLINDAMATAAQGSDGRATAIIPDMFYGGTKFIADGKEMRNIYTGATDSVFANITQGGDKWDDFVPDYSAGSPAMVQRFGRQFDVLEEQEALASQRQTIADRLAVLGSEEATERATAAQAGRRIGGQRSAATRAEQRVRQMQADANRKPVELDNTRMTIKEAGGLSKAETSKLNTTLKQMNDEIDKDPAVRSYRNKTTQEKIARATKTFEAEYALRADHERWANEVAPLLDEDIETISQLIDDMPATTPAGNTAKSWMRRVRDLDYALRTDDLLKQDPALRRAWEQSTRSMFAMEADLALLESQRVISQKVVDDIASGLVGATEAKHILDGWAELEGLGVQIPQELRNEMLTGIRRIADPAEFSRAMKWYLEYQRFFKSYAIATVGFTVRNAMTAVFNNLVADVSWSDTGKALKFARDYRRRGLDYALNQITDPAERAIYDDAYRAVARSGGGQAVDELMPLVKGQGNRIYNNFYTRFFQRNNEAVEIAARFGMALDGVRKGLTPDQNAARITRYHFDYSDLSRLDRVAKTFIPFWTFASRNIQLQIVNQFVRPKWYSRYEALRRSDSEQDTSMFPLWLRERDPLAIGENRVIDLDLPQVDMEQKFQQMLSPQRLASMTNPLFRTIIEAMTGESTAFDYPFSTKDRGLGITDLPSALVAAGPTAFFGGSLRGGGEGVFGLQSGDFVQNLGPSLLPPLQQLQRLVKPIMNAAGASDEAQQRFGGPERYSERDLMTTLGSFSGIPFRQVTEKDISNEMRRRQFLLDEILRDAISD